MADFSVLNRWTSTILTVGRNGGVPLPWWKNESRRRRKLQRCYDILVAVFVLFKITCSSYACGHNEKMEDKIYCMAVLIFLLTSGLLLIYYTFYGSGFERLISRSDKVTLLIADCRLGYLDEFMTLHRRDSNYLTQFAKMMRASSVICPFFFCLSVPVLGLIQGNYGERLALPMRCPFEKSYAGLYELVIFLQFVSLAIPGLVILGNECMMIALFRIHRAYFKYLCLAMKGIGNQIAETNTFSYQKLYLWMKLHQHAIKSSESLVEFYSPIIFMYFLCITGMIAGATLYQLQAKDANVIQSQFLGAYMATTMLRLYLLCHTAGDLTTEAGKVAFETYSIPWYELEPVYKRLVRLVICMSNRALHVDGYRAPAFRLNKESFQGLFLGSVSTYLGFSKIMEMSE